MIDFLVVYKNVSFIYHHLSLNTQSKENNSGQTGGYRQEAQRF